MPPSTPATSALRTALSRRPAQVVSLPCAPTPALARIARCSDRHCDAVRTYQAVASNRFPLPVQPSARPSSLRTVASSALLKSASTSPSTPSSVQDLEQETGLYYHPTTINVSDGTTERPTNVWAISYLPKPPASSNSATIVAFILPPKGSDGEDMHSVDPATYVRDNPDRISVNPSFWSLFHETLKTEVVPTDDLLDFEASTRKSGWAHLTDLRHPLNPGRIATPESIIASVAFVDGQLNIDSYEPNASYRLVTGYEGPMHLRPAWIEKLRAKLRQLD